MYPDSQYAHPVSSFNVPVLPPTDDPDVGTCLTISISEAWLPYILGSLKQLWLQSTWRTDDPMILAITQARALKLMSMFALAPTALCEDVNALAPKFQVVACQLQVSYDNQVTWQTLVDLTTCEGTAGPGEGYISPPAVTETNPTAEQLACGIADWSTLQFHEVWGDLRDLWQVEIDSLKTGVQVVSDIIGLFARITIVGDKLIDVATDLAVGATQATFDAIAAQDTLAFQEAVKCKLFCLLKETDGDFGADKSVVIDKWADSIEATEALPISNLYAETIRAIDLNWWRKNARVGADYPGQCDDCPDCTPVGDIILLYPHGVKGPTNVNLHEEFTVTASDIGSYWQLNFTSQDQPHTLTLVSTTGRTITDGNSAFWGWRDASTNFVGDQGYTYAAGISHADYCGMVVNSHDDFTNVYRFD